MSKTSAPYLLKKFKTRSPFWYYKLRGWDSYKSTKKRSYIKAAEWVESEILNKRPKQIDPTIAEYCENFFIPGKCKWVVRQSLRGNELKQSTINWRRRMLENHVLPNFGHYRFHEITPQIIEYTIALFPL